MGSVFHDFPLTDQEHAEITAKFDGLLNFESWQLLRKNAKNNHTDEFDDIKQNVHLAMVRASCYTKRQVYIEKCLAAAREHCTDPFVLRVVAELEDLWSKRTKHGAHRQKFGAFQEDMLESLVQTHVPEEARPDRKAPLVVNEKFVRYCKSVTWNCQKSMGKQITREKPFRTGLVSLSEHSHLGA